MSNQELCEPNCEHEAKGSKLNMPINGEVLEETASILSAMSDTARLSILLMLDQGEELCVSEIADVLGDKVNTISMRLKKLYDAGLVSKRREAKHIYYRLKDEHIVTIIHNAIEHAKHTHK